MLAMGYAVLDNPSMPIVGVGDAEPNDSYLAQLVSNAEAAVDEVVRRGVAERHRIAVGGHSYGAFMTGNLLSNTRLFRAGDCAQRGVQPHAHAVRLPVGGASVLGREGGVSGHVAV